MNENIEIHDLNVEFFTNGRQITALKDVHITFREGRITGLIGESGSGKSVLGMSILKLLPDTAKIKGSCMFLGKDLYQLNEREICRLRYKEISLIPQNPLMSLNPVLKIRRQLTEPLRLHLGMSKKKAYETACENLKQFGFSEPENLMCQYSFQMSGGMNQRIVSCMGLECNPRWVIADEPTKGLDAILRRQVYQVLHKVKESGNKSMILITHDLQLAEKLCDDIAVLYQGQIIEQGEKKKVLENPLHPYTFGLMQSVPSKGMHPIPQPKKDRKKEDSGCPFYNRCQKAEECCKKKQIPDVVKEDQIVRCIQYA